jgi:dihydrofolate reductase
MGKLIYSMMMSLDGYVVDEDGNFDWSAPDEQVHTFINEVERPVGTHLYGRRMYEVMAVWETDDMITGQPPYIQDYAAIWRAADKIVYSRTLERPASARTRIEREFDPDAVRAMKAAADRDLTIAGPDLAAHAIRAGLVDEFGFYVAPVIVGGGTRALPDRARHDLELLDERRFDGGMLYLRYRTRT